MSQERNPLALPIPDAAKLLSHVGGTEIAAESIRADVAAGAPTNPDGTLNLVEYAAWLLKQEARRGH